MTNGIKQHWICFPFLKWGILLVFLLTSFTSVQADVEPSSGEFYSNSDDLVVKVMGGHINAQRTWYKGKWEFNRAWNPLDITYDNDTGDVISIKRNNDLYKKSTSGDIYTLEFDKRRTITKTTDGFKWADRNGNWIDYDSNGRILSYGDRNNVTNTLLYDTEGRRTGVQDHFGNQVLWYAYDTNDHLISVRDHADVAQARQAQYHYTGDLITSITDVLGKTWTYSYTNDVLTRIEDPDGRITETSYGAAGRVNEIKQPNGVVASHHFDYDKVKKQFYSRRSYSNGKVVELWFNKEGKLIRRDDNGVTVAKGIFDDRRRETINELGHTTVREYDEWDNLIKITHPDNTSRSYKYDTKYSNLLEEKDERGIVTKYEYDTNGNLIRKTEAAGKPEQRIIEYTYDDYGNMLTEKRLGDAVTEEALTTYTYDNYGNQKSKTMSVSTAESHTIAYDSYDRMGNVQQWRDSRGKIWKQAYDEKGQRISKTDPLNYMFTYEYDSNGNLTRITNPEDKHTRYIYNIENQLERVINAEGGEKRYVYNDIGQLINSIDEENYASEHIFDDKGRLEQIVDAAGNSIKLNYGVEVSRNVLQGKVSAIDYPTYRQELKYNSRGHLIQSTDILDANTFYITQKDYDPLGKVLNVTDAEQKTTHYSYDNLGRLIRITHPDTSTISYTYDNRDNLLTVANEKQAIIRRYVYDRKNRRTKEIWANGEIHHYSYDESDNLVQKIDAENQVMRISYDDANRKYVVSYYDNDTITTPAKVVRYTYNSLNKITGYNDNLTSATYKYDDIQNKIGETINFGAFIKTVSYTYKKNRLKATYTDPDGVTVTYSYDSKNRLSQVILPNEGNITYNDYRWLGPSKISYPGGSVRDIQYDQLMRQKRITTRDPAKNILMDYQYQYDKVGNVKIKSTEHGDYVYGYDDRYRLISVDNPSSQDEVFTYDVAGNRLTDAVTNEQWEYNNANQLLSYDNKKFGYDNNGNQTSKISGASTDTYLYDHENRLTKTFSDNNANTIFYYYDPFGRRLWKEVDGVRTYFIYNADGLIAELDANGNVIRSYGYAPQSDYGTNLLYVRSESGYSYLHSDHLNTPQVILNSAGQVQWQGRQLAFGKITELVSLKKNPIRFPGQYRDGETGYHYNMYRVYDPDIGRYITSDPIGIDGDINTYAYTKNNPIFYYDSLGLYSVCEVVAAVPVDFRFSSKTEWEEWDKWKYVTHHLEGGKFPVFWWVAKCICQKQRSGIKESKFEIKWRYIEVCVGTCGLSSNEYDDWETEWENTKTVGDAESKIISGGYHLNEVTADLACREGCDGLNTGK